MIGEEGLDRKHLGVRKDPGWNIIDFGSRNRAGEPAWTEAYVVSQCLDLICVRFYSYEGYASSNGKTRTVETPGDVELG